MKTQIQTQNNYDPRLFIWTIVFLVATGIMLVSYIVTSDPSSGVSGEVTTKTVARNSK